MSSPPQPPARCIAATLLALMLALPLLPACGGGGGGSEPIAPTPLPPGPTPPVPTPDPPTISVADAEIAEGDTQAATLVFEVRLSAAAADTVRIDYASADGSAHAARDYIAASGSLSFAPGETLKTIQVHSLPDRLVEGDETLTLTLSALPATVVAGRLQATGTLRDDERGTQRQRLDWSLELPTAYTNPFDPDEVELSLRVTRPDGNVTVVPAFWYQDAVAINELRERYELVGQPSWRARFAPTQVGAHRWQWRLRDGAGEREVGPSGTLVVDPGAARGIVRRDARDARFLRHDDGTPFVPIGHNIAWEDGSGLGTAYWERVYGAMAAQGANWSRLHLIHYWDGQGLEWTPGNGYYEGLGRYSLALGWKLDRIVEAAERHGIHLQLVPYNNVFFSTTIFPQWDANPFNLANAASGGFLARPQDFFTDARARALAKRQLRYLVARWGGSAAVLAWELFNEADLVDGFYDDEGTRAAVIAWHAEMAAYLRSIDPSAHLVTTSAAVDTRFDPVWSLPDIDLVQHHNYRPDKVAGISDDIARLAALAKPTLIGEFGAADQQAETRVETLPEPGRSQMRDGLMLHNGIWAASVQGSGAMLWWWDVYIDALDLYPVYAPLAAFWAGEDPASHALAPAIGTVSGGPALGRLSLVPGVEGFYAVPTRTEFVVGADGLVAGADALLRWLHGQGHETQRSDPVFEADFGADGRLVVSVDEVSPYAAAVEVWVDGTRVLERSFAGGETGVEISVAVPAGRHRVQLRNSGNDWLKIAAYRLEGLAAPAVRLHGMLGATGGYLWLHDRGSQYGDTPAGTVSGLGLSLEGVADGRWEVGYWATRGVGGRVASLSATASGGTLALSPPAFDGDLAVKLMKTP